MTEHILDELTWRGLVSITTGDDALRAALDAGPITLYCGFDPTAPSLHIGNLVQILTVRRLQDAGHHPLLLVGGATGLIGDPKEAGDRVLNPVDLVHQWVERIRAQIEPFMRFDGDNPARMVNNFDWTKDMSAIQLLRDVGKHFRLGTMIAKDTVARRLNSEEGISYTEFSYQVLQGMDYLELFRRYGCTLQTGGSDQWGNLTAGTELVRKAEGTSVHALATPLITKADGTKFGKTETGTVWLDGELTSPYAFYQFWLNAADADVIGYLKVFTFLNRDEIARLENAVAQEPFKREAQRTLAWEVTSLVHGPDAVAKVVAASQAIFGGGEVGSLDRETLAGIAREVPFAEVAAGSSYVDALVAAGIVGSRGEARRAIAEGGAYLNNGRVADEGQLLERSGAVAGEYFLLRRGKKSFGLARISDA